MLLYIENAGSNAQFHTEDGALWYTIDSSSPWQVSNQATTVMRHQPHSQAVGHVMWKTTSATMVRIGSVELERKQFLREKGMFSG